MEHETPARKRFTVFHTFHSTPAFPQPDQARTCRMKSSTCRSRLADTDDRSLAAFRTVPDTSVAPVVEAESREVAEDIPEGVPAVLRHPLEPPSEGG